MAWVYKATRKKTDFAATLLLARGKGFLCRSAHEENESWADNVRDVVVGDTIHFYYIDGPKGPRPVGSFEVIDRSAHAIPSLFGSTVEGTALQTVADPALASHLATLGDYKPDPVLDVFTGWALKKAEVAPPKYNPDMFPGRSTLKRYG